MQNMEEEQPKRRGRPPKNPEPVEVKAPEPEEPKNPEPVEVKAPELEEPKNPEPVEVKAPEPEEPKGPRNLTYERLVDQVGEAQAKRMVAL